VSELRVVVEADGGARGNPGPAGYGAVVREAPTGEILLERHGSLGTTTNNVAEYSGLIAGLQAAQELGATHVGVRMDSKLVIEQMSGRRPGFLICQRPDICSMTSLESIRTSTWVAFSSAAARRPAIRPWYSATLFVVVPSAAYRSSSTSPVAASRTTAP